MYLLQKHQWNILPGKLLCENLLSSFVRECQQNAVEFSDGFPEKKKQKQKNQKAKDKNSIPRMKDTALVNSYWTSRFLRDCN